MAVIGIDAYNGDIDSRGAPPSKRMIDAVLQISQEYPDLKVVLAGDEREILNALGKRDLPESASILPNGNGEPNINLLARLARTGAIQGIFTIGDSAKVGKMRLGFLKGVEKVALIATLPAYPKGDFLLADAGATRLNQNGKRDKLHTDAISEFARDIYCQGVMAAVYAREMLGIQQPRLGLLTIGKEFHKGSELVFETEAFFQKMQERGLSRLLDYRGRAEPEDAFFGNVDILLTDGHTGNIFLKTIESVIKTAKAIASSELSRLEKAYLSPILLSKRIRKARDRCNPARYNGAYVAGLDGILLKGHGSSSSTACYSGIKRTISHIERDIRPVITEALERYMPQ